MCQSLSSPPVVFSSHLCIPKSRVLSPATSRFVFPPTIQVKSRRKRKRRGNSPEKKSGNVQKCASVTNQRTSSLKESVCVCARSCACTRALVACHSPLCLSKRLLSKNQLDTNTGSQLVASQNLKVLIERFSQI